MSLQVDFLPRSFCSHSSNGGSCWVFCVGVFVADDDVSGDGDDGANRRFPMFGVPEKEMFRMIKRSRPD